MRIDIPMRSSGSISCRDLTQHIPKRKQPTISARTLQPRQPVYDRITTPQQQPSAYVAAAPVAPAAAPPLVSVPTPPLPGDATVLQKGQKVNISGKNGAPLQSIVLGVGWQLKNSACELDMSAFMLDGNSRIIGDDWFVFYGQPVSPDGSIRFSDTPGADRESISVDLQRVSPSVQRIAFVVTINEAVQRHLNFSMVQDVYIRIIDAASSTETARFLLTDYYSNVTAMVVGELYRYKGVWKLNAVGDGVAKDLAGLCAMYGVEVEGG